MANIREIAKKFTKDEAKELLEKSKQIIDDKVLGENFKRNKLLNKKNEVKSDVKVDNKPEETINNELVTKIETKTKLPKVDAQKSDNILFKVKKGGKITPTMLDDFNIDKMNSKDDIIKFIDDGC